MGKTDRSTWKKRESQAAAIFGAKRQRCSGSSGRADLSRSDSTHPKLFLEVKLQATTPLRDTLDEVRRERLPLDERICVLSVSVPGDKQPTAVVHSLDLGRFFSQGAKWSIYHHTPPRSATLTLLASTEPFALQEKKTAVLLIATKGKVGFLVAFRLDQFKRVRDEYLAANSPDRPSQGEAA